MAAEEEEEEVAMVVAVEEGVEQNDAATQTSLIC